MMTFFGTIRTSGIFEVKGKDGSIKQLISFKAVDGLGNVFDCQMWPDDPKHGELLQLIPQVRRRQPVQFEIASYTARLRKYKDGKQEPQLNLIVTNVGFPNPQQAALPASVMMFSGMVKGGMSFPIKGGPDRLLSFTVADEMANTWPCQMWKDDPQQDQLIAVIPSARRQPVQLEVVSYSLRMRKMPDGKEQPQVNFVVSRVSLPTLKIQAA